MDPVACYRIALLLYMKMIFVPPRKRTYEPPRSVTGIALLFALPLSKIRFHALSTPQLQSSTRLLGNGYKCALPEDKQTEG
jgi:hypothetical protein